MRTMSDREHGQHAEPQPPRGREASASTLTMRSLWRALPSRSRLDQAIAERDRARVERDSLRRALKAARDQRDAAREAVRGAEAQRDLAREDLRNIQSTYDALRDEVISARAEGAAAHESLLSLLREQETTLLREQETTRRTLERSHGEAEEARSERDTQLLASAVDMAREIREMRALEVAMDRRIRFLHRELITDLQAMHQLLDRYRPEARLPAVAGWALSPSGLLALVDLIETRNAVSVVECGSGTSTLWIGYALKRLGRGRVTAIDHLPEYADRTRAIVAAHGLSEFVDVRLAPLSPRQTPRGEFPWYSFHPADVIAPIDVLLVDGPPQSTGRHARYPALPLLLEHLAPRAAIVVDDADRHDETEMLGYWTEEVPRLRRIETAGPGIEVLELEPE